MKYKVIIFISTWLILTSCTDIVNLKLPEGKTTLVVDSWISTEDAPFQVTLTKTAPYFQGSETPRVRGAIVVLTDNEGIRDSLIESLPGLYATKYNKPGKIGNKYQLYIETNGQKFLAQTEIRRIAEIDSVSVRPSTKVTDEKGAFNIYYYGPEPEGEGDFYRFRLTINDTIQNKPEDLWNVTSDEQVDGNYIGNLKLNDKYLHHFLYIR